MAQAKTGDIVRVHYTGKLEDGTVFDSSLEREPLEFTIGQKQMIPGFEEAITGMSLNESINTTIPADQAYGERREDLVLEVERDRFPEDIAPEVNQQLQFDKPNGEKIIVTITKVSDSNITLDANHPLAGKNLTFDIQLVEII